MTQEEYDKKVAEYYETNTEKQIELELVYELVYKTLSARNKAKYEKKIKENIVNQVVNSSIFQFITGAVTLNPSRYKLKEYLKNLGLCEMRIVKNNPNSEVIYIKDKKIFLEYGSVHKCKYYVLIGILDDYNVFQCFDISRLPKPK